MCATKYLVVRSNVFLVSSVVYASQLVKNTRITGPHDCDRHRKLQSCALPVKKLLPATLLCSSVRTKPPLNL